MNNYNTFFIMMLLIGAVFFIVGLILRLFPPKKINSFYGYRTKKSKMHQEAWDFSQKIASLFLLIIGFDGLLLAFVGAKSNISETLGLILIGVYLLFAVIFIFAGVEYQLKKKFTKK